MNLRTQAVGSTFLQPKLRPHDREKQPHYLPIPLLGVKPIAMGTLSTTIMDDIKTAMKAKDTVSLNTLRALKTAITNAAIEKGGLGTELTDAEEIGIVRKQLKQREDSKSQFENAGRAELAATEAAEMEVLNKYLPAAMSLEDIVSAVESAIAETGATGKADMGKVMNLLKEKTEGRADGKILSQEVAKRLS